MKHLTLLSLLFISLTTFSQECDCEAEFQWVKTTFEENDAGFTYVIDKKGEKAYASHNEELLAKIKQTHTTDSCIELIQEWFSFFRAGHLSIRRNTRIATNTSTTNEAPSNEDIIQQFKDWERLDVNLEEFKNYLAQKNTIDFEGIWVSEPYTIGVKKVKNEYVGFVIEADGVFWTPGQIKFKIQADKSAVFYMRDHSKQEFSSSELLGDNYLLIGFIDFKRTVPRYANNSEVENYFNILAANKPFFKELDAHTSYIRIPTFQGTEKKSIDSVLQANRNSILKSQNFIIDIRNNGGGSDSSYYELLPFMYTNPIRTVGVEMLSTPLNNQRMIDFIEDPIYGFNEENKKWAKESYDKLSKQLGEFVSLTGKTITTVELDTIHPYPKNVAIIINNQNGSTAEQFLLAAKQSKKVKLYGTTTAGVLDISNMYFVTSPSKQLEMGYSLSRSMRIPDMTIDSKGIQPDYYIDKSIPKYQWLNFVQENLKEE